MRPGTRAAAGAAVLLAVAACASVGTADDGGDRNLITRTEVDASNALNALELIRAERPQWLRVRGTPSISQPAELMVYVDQARAGTFEALRGIQTREIEEIRYFNAREAQVRFGAGHVQGVIQVFTRRS